VATLVLATRYRHRPVLIGVAAAFAVQCVIAAIAGRLLYLLPKRAVEAAIAVLFAIGRSCSFGNHSASRRMRRSRR
jgi:Ca2+/H+ antiporter, TMEM165/GDT1 family